MSPTPMQYIDAREKSFERVAKRGKGARAGWPLSATTHPKLTPRRLAEAGFFFNPSPDIANDDTCMCFYCGLQLGGWDEGDDPFAEHAQRGNCAWGEMVCAPRVEREKGGVAIIVSDSNLLPDSTASIAARFNTYGKDGNGAYWPHKSKKGWQPTVQALAAGGFVYYGTEETKDCVMCPFCNWTPAEWEATDVPIDLHREKRPHCEFFHIHLDPAVAAASSQPKQTKARAVRGKRATVAASQAESVAGDDELLAMISAVELPDAAEAISKPGRKPRGTAATTLSAATAPAPPKRGRGKKAAGSEVPESVVGQEETGVTEAEVQPEVGIFVASQNAGDTPLKPKRKPGRPRKNDVSAPPATEDDIQPESASLPSRATVASETTKKPRKPRATKASKKADAEVEVEVEVEVEAGPSDAFGVSTREPPASPDASKSTRSARAPISQTQALAETGLAAEQDTAAVSIDNARPIAGIPHRSARTKSSRASKLDSSASISTASGPSAPTAQHSSPRIGAASAPASRTVVAESSDLGSTQPALSVKSQPARGKPKASAASKPLPPLPPPSDPPTPRAQIPRIPRQQYHPQPLNSLADFANIPPTSPLGNDKGLPEGYRSIDAVLDPASKSQPEMSASSSALEAWMTAPLSPEERKMTLEQLIRKESARRYELLKAEGEEQIRLFEEKANEARRRLEAAL